MTNEEGFGYHDTEPTKEQLLEANHDLAARLRSLSSVLASMTARLEDSKRELMAQGWDAAMSEVNANAWIEWAIGAPPANPYREDPTAQWAPFAEFTTEEEK